MGRPAFTPAQRKAHGQAIRVALARRKQNSTIEVHQPASQLARQITKMKFDVAILESALTILTGGGHASGTGQ